MNIIDFSIGLIHELGKYNIESILYQLARNIITFGIELI